MGCGGCFERGGLRRAGLGKQQAFKNAEGSMAKLKAVHAEDLQRREDLALKSEEQASDPRLAEIVAGLGERAQMLEELMGEAGLLHPPPLPQ